ncbi:MAG: adenylate/guanylate cyclase domain-containing protein [Thermoleophilaceae bacterium]|nr:adenylate/guanylate cyclase domain-containing protein [Thermoleophilaceae bacterium]
MLSGKRKYAWLFALSALTTALVILLWAAGGMKTLELSTVDQRFDIRGNLPSQEAKNVVLVSIDDETFSELRLRWPFRRSVQATVIDNLSKAGAKVIVEDIMYSEPSLPPYENDDYVLAESITNAGNVVLATSETDPRTGETPVMGGNDNVKAMNATVGNSILATDTDGVIRRFNRMRGGIPTLSVAAVTRATGTMPGKENFPHKSAWINFIGGEGRIQQVPFSAVYTGHFNKRAVKGKIVVVGATNETLHDVHRTSSSKAMAGPEIHANAIATILNVFPMSKSPWFVVLLLILLFGFAEPLLNLRVDPREAFLICLGGAIFYVLLVIYVFNLGYILPVTYPLIALALSMVASLGVNFLSAAFERERVRNEFARFAPDSVVDQVLDEAGDGNKLGGKRVVATLLFSDLRGFTTFSEKLQPELVIATLNDYLTEMSEAILDHHGTLVSFMGDGIMAVFGAPVETDDHADKALAAAREMLARMHFFNQRMADAGLGSGFKMGIGLNTGPVMSGNVGSERRLEYTAIGDTTNTAARLEGMTKGTPYQLYISQETYDALSEPPADFEFVEEMAVRGREASLRVWGLVDDEDVSDLDPAQPPAPGEDLPPEPIWTPTS